jgi:hypothetical protein
MRRHVETPEKSFHPSCAPTGQSCLPSRACRQKTCRAKTLSDPVALGALAVRTQCTPNQRRNGRSPTQSADSTATIRKRDMRTKSSSTNGRHCTVCVLLTQSTESSTAAQWPLWSFRTLFLCGFGMNRRFPLSVVANHKTACTDHSHQAHLSRRALLRGFGDGLTLRQEPRPGVTRLIL